MSSSYGKDIRITIFGQSHSPAIGVTIEGIPAGQEIDFDELSAFMGRRAPGKNEFSTARREPDMPEFISGLKGNVTCGTPLTAIIRNMDTRSQDYDAFKRIPRPGHADYTAHVKYGGAQDAAGGGHFSGRMTAPLCVAGGIFMQLLRKEGIEIISRIASIGDVSDEGELTASTAGKQFPTVSDTQGEKMRECIARAKADCDSVGGIIECRVLGVPAGLGDPMFDGMENRIAQAVFGVPAVKGIEFGVGFKAAALRGSENNDCFEIKDNKVVTGTNNCGGILGGITDGMEIIFRAAMKPTPSIAKEQNTLNLETGEQDVLKVGGRHDPCIVPRAVPCIESAAAAAVYDALLARRKEMR